MATSWVALVGQVAPQPLEGAIAIAPGLVEPAQVMAGQGQQEAVEGRRVGPRRGPGQDGGGRRPVAEEVVGRPESRQAVPLGVGLDRLAGSARRAGTAGS